MIFILRPWQASDLDSLVSNGLHPEIAQFMSDGFPNTKEKWKKFLEYTSNNVQNLYFAIDYQGQAIGGIGIHFETKEKYKNAELGYWLAKPYWGKGIITNAILQITQITIQRHAEIEGIYARPYGTNKASHRVLEKNGFKLETVLKNAIIKNGEILDEYVYVLHKQ